MKKIIIVFSILILIIFSIVTTSEAFSSDCNLISVGDSTYEVLRRCGTPIYTELIRVGGAEQKVEHWIYSPKGEYYYCLVFSDGKLFKIDNFKK